MLLLSSILFLILGCGLRGAGGDPSKDIEQTNEDKAAAHVALETGEYGRVIDLLKPWADRRSRDPQIYSMLAKAKWRLGAYDEAIAYYEQALRLDYSDAILHVELAQLLIDLGKVGRALTEFDLAVQTGPANPLVHYNYGLALYEMGRREEALALWETAYSLDDTDPRYAEAMGIGLTGQDDREAIRYFERAAELGADDALFHNNFGLLLQRVGDYARAETEFEEALDAEPANEIYRRNLALLYMVSKQYGAAIPIWENLLHEAGDDRTSRIYLARAYLEQGRNASVIEVLEEWLGRVEVDQGADSPAAGNTSAPPLGEAYGVLAMAYRGQEDLDSALFWIRKALESMPDNVVHLNNYGVILAESGNIIGARAQWERVLSIDPGNTTALENLSAFDR